jgi:hypothetical protein
MTRDHNASAPQSDAHRLLVEARDLITVALDAVKADNDPQRAAELVGRSSDRIGQALYHMRQLLQRR